MKCTHKNHPTEQIEILSLGEWWYEKFFLMGAPWSNSCATIAVVEAQSEQDALEIFLESDAASWMEIGENEILDYFDADTVDSLRQSGLTDEQIRNKLFNDGYDFHGYWADGGKMFDIDNLTQHEIDPMDLTMVDPDPLWQTDPITYHAFIERDNAPLDPRYHSSDPFADILQWHDSYNEYGYPIGLYVSDPDQADYRIRYDGLNYCLDFPQIEFDHPRQRYFETIEQATEFAQQHYFALCHYIDSLPDARDLVA